MKTTRRPATRRSPEKDPALTPLSCPDCGGVLRVEQEVSHSLKLYVCQIDHRYSGMTLFQAKEDHIEYTLWSAVVQLKQLQMLYETLRGGKVLPAGIQRKRIERRIREVERHRTTIQALIEDTNLL